MMFGKKKIKKPHIEVLLFWRNSTFSRISRFMVRIKVWVRSPKPKVVKG